MKRRLAPPAGMKRALVLALVLVGSPISSQPWQPDGEYANACVASRVERSVNGVKVLPRTVGRVIGPGRGGAAYLYSVQWAKGFDPQGVVVAPVHDALVSHTMLEAVESCQPYVDEYAR